MDKCSEISYFFTHIDNISRKLVFDFDNVLHTKYFIQKYYECVIEHIHYLALCQNSSYHKLFVSQDVKIRIRGKKEYTGIDNFKKYFNMATGIGNIEMIHMIEPIILNIFGGSVSATVTVGQGPEKNNNKMEYYVGEVMSVKTTIYFDKYGRIDFISNY